MKNEHIVYAYAPNAEKGGYVLIIGLTPAGCDYLKENPGMTLTVTEKRFTELTDVVVFGAESKQAIKTSFRTRRLVASNATSKGSVSAWE